MTTSDDDLHIKVQANIAAILFILAVAIGLTALFLLGGLYELSRTIDAGAIILFLIGLFGIWVVYRLYLYYFKPQFSVTGDRVVARRFLRAPQTLLFSDTAKWRAEVQVVTHAYIMGRMRKLRTPLNIEHLIQTDQMGQDHKITLPRYLGKNDETLKRIAKNSGRLISRTAAQ